MKIKFLILGGLFYSSVCFAQTDELLHHKFTNPKTGIEYTVIDGDTTVIVDVMPQFPGGQEKLIAYLSKKIKYPNKARREGMQGKVLIQFTIDREGSVRDIVIKKGIREDIDNEAIKIVARMPKWTPGYQNDKPIPVNYILPLNYTLKD